MKPKESHYKYLLEHEKKTATLQSCSALLSWDRETYMPPAGTEHRAEQLALLSGLAHERSIDPRIEEWLSTCEASELNSDDHSVTGTNIREWRRTYDKKIRLTKSFVEELARTTSLGHHAWIEARDKSEFGLFLPWLDKIVKLKREYADLTGNGKEPYDALIDDYEPGECAANINIVFAALKNELVPLIDGISNSRHQPDLSVLNKKFPVDRQRDFGKLAAKTIGFDFNSGRLDTVVHPFCCGVGRGDTRITTRWDANDFSSAFFGIIHEIGHGLYDQNLPLEHWGTPAGEAVSLGIHESQSRLWENIVARGQPFWTYFYPKLQKTFSTSLGAVPFGQFLHAINHVERSFIRVEADEATYTLHIILRFEIEQMIISGEVAPKDIPLLWNSKFKELFDLEVPDDAQGCLQDVHWSYGSFGYFPTYALGTLYAAQLYYQARVEIPDMEDQFADGDFSPLLNWLKDNIHSKGMRYTAPELVQAVTGQTLDHKFLIQNLKDKFARLYELP